jgi:prepilin-type N-terminal cleavage/methylation domain-containing protein
VPVLSARRGFSLLELLVALVVLALAAAGIYRALLTSQRTFRAATERVGLDQNLRAAATILPPELRELDAADSDITVMSATSLTIRAMRQLAFVCVDPEVGAGGGGGGGPVQLVVRQRPFFGPRQSFTSGDSVLVYYEGDPAARSDDGWLRGEVTAVGNEDCPDTDKRRPGYRLTLGQRWSSWSALTDPGSITNGSPVRGFTTVTYALYQSPADNQWYLGQRPEGGTLEPLVGPLTGSNGVTFSYRDSSGAVTAAPTAVREIEIRVRGRTTRPVRVASSGVVAYVVDSVVTCVALRNNPRCSRCP